MSNKIVRIIRAKFRNKDKIQDSFYKERLEICKQCPLYSKNTKGVKNLKYKFWDLVNFKKPFCTVCGCEIKAKASEEMETCPEGKWPEITETNK